MSFVSKISTFYEVALIFKSSVSLLFLMQTHHQLLFIIFLIQLIMMGGQRCLMMN